ncbi:dTDP-4-dehydrorhamnose 3,5-epimerase [Rectinema subterraneum]|jgi:dTDP-4-dehydrorhamnose 3,5-epimerase|uniref:dTDP-4-dehydrorhamnose 3,5-epimerase n=1 Tax=Rectinema subterraneum TaxID=2653714 RepID=UPI00131EACC4|nr:dTDP-4-dehydrorhamnose 3,5-epimerase [Rectinema subterraneum]
MPFTFTKAPIEGLVIIEPRAFPDERGFFMESYKQSDFEKAGIFGPFVQDNLSRSKKGVLRGLHFQRAPHAQGKLVRVSRGRAWDVAVDLRAGSPTFGSYFALELSEENRLLFWIPEGFAHGFLALEDDNELQYKCTAEYHAASDGGIRWDDPDLAIAWPDIGMAPIVSAKDAALPLLRELGV